MQADARNEMLREKSPSLLPLLPALAHAPSFFKWAREPGEGRKRWAGSLGGGGRRGGGPEGRERGPGRLETRQSGLSCGRGRTHTHHLPRHFLSLSFSPSSVPRPCHATRKHTGSDHHTHASQVSTETPTIGRFAVCRIFINGE